MLTVVECIETDHVLCYHQADTDAEALADAGLFDDGEEAGRWDVAGRCCFLELAELVLDVGVFAW